MPVSYPCPFQPLQCVLVISKCPTGMETGSHSQTFSFIPLWQYPTYLNPICSTSLQAPPQFINTVSNLYSRLSATISSVKWATPFVPLQSQGRSNSFYSGEAMVQLSVWFAWFAHHMSKQCAPPPHVSRIRIYMYYNS